MATTTTQARRTAPHRAGPTSPGTARHGFGPQASAAATQAVQHNTRRVTLPDGWGTVQVPSPERIAFYGGIVALGLLGIVEWPVALAVGVGHLLAESHHHKLLADFGKALEEA